MKRFHPRSVEEEMVRVFQARAGELFKFTVQLDYYERAKAQYAYLYVRPIKRIARLLAADRELLVLFSAYEDQQARTIQAAIDLIDSSAARLENTIAIIVHRDEYGNAKLKNWGREEGLSVIPLYMRSASLPHGDDLERALFLEFYSQDQFDVSGPVFDDNHFYGRRDEAQDLARQLQEGQVRACLGIRKIGKTSIMNRILYVAEGYHACSQIVVDCSKEGIFNGSAAGLLLAIAEAAEAALGDEDNHAEVVRASTTTDITTAYERLMVAIKATPFPVVIFFDEVDYITPGSPTASSRWTAEFNAFWRNLRAGYQEIKRTEAVMSVFVSGVSSKWFRVESIDGVENAALAFIPEEYLSPLHERAATAMAIDIARTAGLVFDEEIAAVITDACSNIPFWIRKAGSYIHRNIAIDPRPFQPGKGVVSAHVHAFVESEGAALAKVALGHLFTVYPELELVATACYEGKGRDQSAALLSVLERYGVIGGREKFWHFSGQMMREGMRSYLFDRTEVAPALHRTEEETLRFATVDEWAEELAVLAALRGKLEKRLRGIALNFVRYDTLQGRATTLQERLVKAIDARRKGALQNLPPDELIEKYTWYELANLIEREWPLFQKIFGDQPEFRARSQIINLRYDAHAKDMDRADVAEYRRAVQWFEERLARA